ncbi:SGNH/GDSL hydrolase family protein [Aerophototrophica crusticola]|uniref:hypothetical protein n=1 Tax=Aerophototrophica crusticola TaxID=1709002 RepID=UPI0038504794
MALLFAGILVPLGALVPGVALAQGGKPLKIVTLGDSLSAGYKLPKEAAFTSQLEAALKAKGYDVSVPNTGVSGKRPPAAWPGWIGCWRTSRT